MPLGKNLPRIKRKVLSGAPAKDEVEEKQERKSEEKDDEKDRFQSGGEFIIAVLKETTYALPAILVKEIVWLPELNPIDEAPEYIAGVCNYRGEVIPVIDLNLRLGYEYLPVNVTDRLIVLEFKGITVGIIFNRIENVLQIKEEQIQEAPRYSPEEKLLNRFIKQVIKTEDQIILILDVSTLFSAAVQDLPEKINGRRSNKQKSRRYFATHLSGNEREILRKRALELSIPQESAEILLKEQYVLFQIEEEYFCVKLNQIREFCSLPDFCPIPDVPPYLLGLINLRGEIYVLMDVFKFLGIEHDIKSQERLEIIIYRDQSARTGIIVDRILDVIGVEEENLLPPPAESSGTSLSKVLIGSIQYGNIMASVIDLDAVFNSEEIIIEEEVI